MLYWTASHIQIAHVHGIDRLFKHTSSLVKPLYVQGRAAHEMFEEPFGYPRLMGKSKEEWYGS